MVNALLVAASLKAFEELLKDNDIPYVIDEDDAYRGYMKVWESSDEKELAMRKARPAIRRIALKEPYIFLKDGDPIVIRLNVQDRKLKKDSFGEIMLERSDKDWHISLSVKNDARVIATLPVADRDAATFMDRVVNVYNEIDDFGERVFGVPCSNAYFTDMNAILEKIGPRDRETWTEYLKDDDFVYEQMIFPMLKAFGDEVKRICEEHPEAPEKMLDYFYGKIDYYYINPISQVGVTRIGAINPRGGLGRIPGTNNNFTPRVAFPTKLLDVRFANGKYGELSKDTIQFSFDGGWSICITLLESITQEHGRNFGLNIYLPVTPFGSYRDQVVWDPEA